MDGAEILTLVSSAEVVLIGAALDLDGWPSRDTLPLQAGEDEGCCRGDFSSVSGLLMRRKLHLQIII